MAASLLHEWCQGDSVAELQAETYVCFALSTLPLPCLHAYLLHHRPGKHILRQSLTQAQHVLCTLVHEFSTLLISPAAAHMLDTIHPEAQALILSSAEDFQMSCSTPGLAMKATIKAEQV